MATTPLIFYMSKPPSASELTANTAIEPILARAGLMEFVAAALSDPLAPPAFEAAQRAARHLHQALESQVAGLRAAFESEKRQSLRGEWTRLFEAQVACSPYESSAVEDAAQKATILADVNGFYAAFGMKVAGNMADHIVAELEFAAHLLTKLAYAESQGMTEQAEITADALGKFCREHLVPFAERFFPSLHHATRVEFYRQVALLGEKVVELLR